MRNTGYIWLVAILMLLLDLYIFQGIKAVSQSGSPRLRQFIYTSYWGISILAVLVLIAFVYINFDPWPNSIKKYVFVVILSLFFAKLIAAVFFLIDDLRRLIQWGTGKLFFKNTEGENLSEDGISRSAFLSWVGIGLGGGLFSSLMYGFTNKYNYQLTKVKLHFNNLPPEFKGLKIIHISDIHSGSFTNKSAVSKGVDKAMAEKPDLILFTGDLVNDRAIEMTDYMDVFNRLKAPMGVFSTLGNHDYGDYYYGRDPEGDQAVEKVKNLEHLKTLQAELGWRLLMNEHVILEKNGAEIALIGIENWSAKKRFPKYGKMNLAYPGSEKYPFKILMSHDPSHWDAEVRTKYPDVDLTLSGHTHGMQFGVEIPGIKWSPVQYVYKEWAGLYEEANQKLYVNRGYGFIGYPGRVGILPEITLIELT